MGTTSTTNLVLVKPNPFEEEDTWGPIINTNWDTIAALFDAGPALKVTRGGTGATTAAGARTNLGLAIGTDVQAYDADLAAIGAIAGTSGLLRKTAANTWTLETTAYAPLASPTFTGVPAAPTAAVDTNTTQLATTAYVIGQGYLKSSTALSTYAPLASPALTGTPTAPTAAANTSTTQLATTAFVLGQANSTDATITMSGTQSAGTSGLYARADHVHPTDTSRAPLASPAFTGTPTAPTATAGTNTTQVATTAFVKSAVGAVEGIVDLGVISTTSGNPASISLGISLAPFKILRLIFNGVSKTGTGTPDLQLEGITTMTLMTAVSSAAAFNGVVEIDLPPDGGGVAVSTLVDGSGVATTRVGFPGISNFSSDVSVSLSNSNTFDAGSIQLYGMR